MARINGGGNDPLQQGGAPLTDIKGTLSERGNKTTLTYPYDSKTMYLY